MMIEATTQTGKWTSYQAYKNSGVEWLGDVPTHWELKRLKFSASINDEALPETTDPDMHLSYVDIGSVHPIHGITSTAEMAFENAPSRARRIVRDGDTIISTVRTYLRAVAAIQDPVPNTIVSTGFAVVRPRSISPSFMSYVLSEQGFIEAIMARSVGVSYPAINASEIGMLSISFPPLLEQRAIAAFLDRETKKIDTLVAKKRTLIERLKEERTALITHTVTRGLPPEAARAAGLEPHPKLKSSGVEWLGEVPTHWEVKKLKNVCSQSALYGANVSSIHYEEEGVRFLRTTDISDEGVLKNGSVFIHPDLIRGYMLNDGDLLLSRSGTVGRSFLYESQYHGPCSYAGYLVRFVPASGVLPKYLFLFTQTQAFHNFLQVMAISSTIENVNGEKYANASFCIPPLLEQRAIADFLDRETTKIDMLMTKIKTAIERLQEYRSALITAAVTGKIDVQEEAAFER